MHCRHVCSCATNFYPDYSERFLAAIVVLGGGGGGGGGQDIPNFFISLSLIPQNNDHETHPFLEAPRPPYKKNLLKPLLVKVSAIFFKNKNTKAVVQNTRGNGDPCILTSKITVRGPSLLGGGG